MNDRELLLLAVKAAGYRMECPDDHDGIFVIREDSRNGYTWNPLDEDGDALRLAVTLDLTIYRPGSQPGVLVRGNESHAIYEASCVRRAIVLAAAEIGKSMQ